MPPAGRQYVSAKPSAQYGLTVRQSPERITARQIEAARRALTRHMKRAGRVWIRLFPDVPVSKKPAEVRMGSGKGAPEFWVARIKPGRILFEVDGVDVETAEGSNAVWPPPNSPSRHVSSPVLRTADKDGSAMTQRIPRMTFAAKSSAGRAYRLSCGKLKQEQFNLRFQEGDGAAGIHFARARSAPRYRPHPDAALQLGKGEAICAARPPGNGDVRGEPPRKKPRLSRRKARGEVRRRKEKEIRQKKPDKKTEKKPASAPRKRTG